MITIIITSVVIPKDRNGIQILKQRIVWSC